MATIIQPTNQDNNELLDEDLIPMPAIAPSQSAAPSTPPPASDPAPLSSPPQDDLIGAPVEADPEPAVTAPAPRSEAEAGEYDDIKLKALTEQCSSKRRTPMVSFGGKSYQQNQPLTFNSD
jgi:hypothetical protein